MYVVKPRFDDPLVPDIHNPDGSLRNAKKVQDVSEKFEKEFPKWGKKNSSKKQQPKAT